MVPARIGPTSASPSRVAPWLGSLARRVAWPLLGIGLSVTPAIASTVTVPDDFATVQQGIDSGADTVLVREGTYSETPLIERDLVLRGIGSYRPRLNELRLTNRNTYTLGTFVSGFDVAGNVGYTQVVNKSPIGVSIADCSMNVLQVDAFNDNCSLSLVRCRLALASSGDRYSGKGVGGITMEADTVGGGVSWVVWSQISVSIQHCWFQGALPGSSAGPAIELLYEPNGPVSHNRIENYGIGISAPDAEGALTLEGNTISGCGTGVQLAGNEGFLLKGNDIRNCGTGVSVSGDVGIIGNTIVGTSGRGVQAYISGSLNAAENVVGNCGGAGMHVEWDPWAYSGGWIRGNTVFNCAGAAMELSWSPAVPYDWVGVANNIGFGSGGWGLSISGTQFWHGCNDWYGNQSGAVNGVAADPTDLNVDPLFCDVANADVRLNSSSPLLADTASCGWIGALGVGCGATPTLVQRFGATRVSAGVEIVWQVADGATASAVWVERAESETGGWTQPATERSQDNRAVVELDRSAMPERAYWYRLVAQEASATVVIGAPIEVAAAARLEFRLTEVGPNPGSGPVRIGFALARASEIEIAVFDVQGRRVATLAHGPWPAGAHELEWNGGTSGGGAAPQGLYVLRYQYPGGQDKRAIARVR